MAILEKSNVLVWSEDQVKNAPSEPGVYVLRNFPSLNGIIYIGSSGAIKERLVEHFTTREIPEVRFFDWYKTDTVEEAQTIERAWISRYSPKYNYRVG